MGKVIRPVCKNCGHAAYHCPASGCNHFDTESCLWCECGEFELGTEAVFAAPALRIPYAVGLALIVSMLTHKSKKPDDEPELPTILATALVVPPIFLGCGWIVKLFV